MTARMFKHVSKHVSLLVVSVLIASCIHSASYEQLPSVNYSFRVKSLVMHYTAINYEKSVEALVEEGFVSSHYLVPESNDATYPFDELKILQLVDENERAWHAGTSYWQGRTALNDSSIGIEIVNVPKCFEDTFAMRQAGMGASAEHGPNRLCVFPDYDPKQIELVIKLSQDILARNPDISPTAVVAHSDIAPSRKNDPGPRFPWFELYKAGVGAWYDENTLAKYWQEFNQAPPNIGLVQAALRQYGYGIVETGIVDQQTIDTLSAFQMHFLPWQVSGNADASTAAAIFALLEKYFPDALEPLLARYDLETRAEQSSMQMSKAQGQLDLTFPLLRSEQRALVNNRATFKTYEKQGRFTLDSLNASSADIYVNQQKLNITLPFEPNTAYDYSLAKRTQDGVNTLRVDNIQPQGAQLNVRIPYPEISQQANASYDFSEVDELISTDVENGFPGAVLLVLHKGKIVKHSAYGHARKYADGGELLAQFEPMQPNTRFDLASNTKTFATTLAIMKLVDEQRISLDNNVSTYLPEYAGSGRESRTISDLLAHASGYSSEVQFFKVDNSIGEHFHSLSPELTRELLLTGVPFESGRQSLQQYSDTNFMILGLLIERVTGLTLDEYIENELYGPLNLSSLQYTPLKKGASISDFAASEIQGNTRSGNLHFDGIREHVLQGEVHDEKAHYSMNGVAGHAGLFGNASDLAVLAQLLINGGAYGETYLFGPATLQRFVSPRYRSDAFGLGWRLAADPSMAWHFGPYASKRAFGHTGWTGTASIIDPEHDLAIILLTNKKHSPVIKEGENLRFTGDTFETGRYGSVMSLVYEAVLQGAP